MLEMSPSLLSQDVVIKQFNDKHGQGRYDYSKVKYIKDNTPVIIGCHKHKQIYWFNQTPHNHKRGDGCPLCRESKMEKTVRLYLNDNQIVGVEREFALRGSRLTLDFYIKQINRNGVDIKLGIECQGIQHYYPVKAFGGESSLSKQQEWDRQKAVLCKNENIVIEYIRYDENVTQRIEEIINKYALASHTPPMGDLS